MKKRFWTVLVGMAVLVGVAVALATGESGEPPDEPEDDGVVLGEEDLAERAEIRRNMYRRMTPPDLPLVQDVGTWPAAWEEFGPNWNGAAMEREYGAWVVPVEVEQTNEATVIRDGTGLELWRGTTDFTRPESAGVILTGGLVAEEDWARYEGVRGAVEEMTAEASRVDEPGPTRTSHTNGLRFTSCEWTTNDTFHMALAYEVDTNVEVFAYAVAHTSALVVATWTNDENVAITDTNLVWYPAGPSFNGLESNWELRGTVAIANGTAEFEDSGFANNLGRVRFYAAAVVEDTDGDGLSDGVEDFVTHTDADNDDSDGDGLDDGDEINLYGTDPTKPDTDGDGLNDGVEINLDLDPTDPDMDDDGLNDGYEQSIGTNPEDPDSDHDGLPDGWEVQNGLAPLDDGTTNVANGPDGDPDGDGFSNALEFELDAPANNAAWNGNELAWKLTHFTSTVTTIGGVTTTNWTGLRVEVEDSADCTECGGTNNLVQNVATTSAVPALLDCGYYLTLVVTGAVEDVDAGFDMVYFEAAATNLLFSSHNGITSGPERCVMIGDSSASNHLILPNSTVALRYDTVGHKWHCGGYAEVIAAVCVAPVDLEIDGPDCMIVGDTAQMSVTGDIGGTYFWSVSGEAANITDGGLLSTVTSGVVVVTATNAGGCTLSKEVAVLSIGNIKVMEMDAPCNQIPNPKQQNHSNTLYVASEVEIGEVQICVVPSIQPVGYEQYVLCALYNGDDHIVSSPVEQDVGAPISFAPVSAIQTNSVKIGLDDNGNGVLDADEFRDVSANRTVVSFTGARYADALGKLNRKGTQAEDYFQIGASLLFRFLARQNPPLPFNTTTNISINCFMQDNLTHNAGEEFDEDGQGNLDWHVWNDMTGDVSQKISESFEIRHEINAMLEQHHDEVVAYFVNNPSATIYTQTWTNHDIAVNFPSPLPIPDVTSYDLHVAFGHATVRELAVTATVVKIPLCDPYVSELSVRGTLEDLYDFNYADGGLSEEGAILQIGWTPYSSSRAAGNIFFDQVFFGESFSSWQFTY